MKIEFDADKHEYTVGGVKIPSVSEILAPLNAERYGSINAMVLQEAARKGTAVHEATEQIDYDIDPEENPEIEGYLEAYYSFLFDHYCDWQMIEQPVAFYLPDNEPPLYCGTVDRFGIVDDDLAVVDIKTYASMTTEAQMTAASQLALYRDAIYFGTPENRERVQDCERVKRYILHLKKDGKYRLIDIDTFEKKRGWNGQAVAWELYEIYRQRQECLKAGKRGKK